VVAHYVGRSWEALARGDRCRGACSIITLPHPHTRLPTQVGSGLAMISGGLPTPWPSQALVGTVPFSCQL
jgi:hypothetical protein